MILHEMAQRRPGKGLMSDQKPQPWNIGKALRIPNNLSRKAAAYQAKYRGTVVEKLVWAFVIFSVMFTLYSGFDYGAYKANKMWKKYLKRTYVRSNTPDQPLVISKDNFYSETRLAELKECLLNNPLLAGNALNKNNFKKTRGFMVRWNTDGIAKLRHKRNLRCMVPFFDQLRLPGTNAWVMNLLIVDNVDYKPGELAVGLHLDQSIKMNSKREHLAHEVDVFYVSIPERMEGGELEVWSFDHKDRLKHVDNPIKEAGLAPDYTVYPKTNKLIRFRGDAFHQIEGYKAPKGELRISLVLEQYKKSFYDYPYTTRFDIKGHDNDDDDF